MSSCSILFFSYLVYLHNHHSQDFVHPQAILRCAYISIAHYSTSLNFSATLVLGFFATFPSKEEVKGVLIFCPQ